MRVLTLLLSILSLSFFVACTGGERAAPGAEENSASNTEDTVDGPRPLPGGGDSEPDSNEPTPLNASPGDIVAVSEGTPGAEYPTVGETVPSGRNPYVEPNSDGNAPIIAIINHPDPYIPQATGAIELWAADDVDGSGVASIQCSIDGAAYVDCTEQVILDNLADGVHTLQAVAEDYDGNRSTEVSYAFYVDTQPPEVSIVKAPDAAVTDPNSSFQFDASDSGSGVSHYQCKIDDQTLQRCDESTDFSGLADGNHALYVHSVDNVGHKSETVIHRWLIDTQGPDIQFVMQPQPVVDIDTDNPTVRFLVTDEYSSEGMVTSCQLNGMAIACASGQNLNVPTTKPENFVFTVTSIDGLGNASSATIQWESRYFAEDKTNIFTVGDSRPVDILFVVDNSGSMNYERSNLAQRIDGMISVISDLDWQIAITSTDSTNKDYKSDGQLLEIHGLPGQYILDSSMDVEVAQAVFGDTVQNFANGSGHEEGIYSSKRVIDRYLAGQAVHNEFIRDGADLSIVLLSDEDENSNGAWMRITPENFVSFVDTSFGGTKNMVFHSIITRPGDTACLEGHGAYMGHTYDELSRLTGYGEIGGAIIGSVCELDYTSQLKDIGKSVKDLRNSLALDCSPYGANGQPELTISYRPDPSSAYTAYTAEHQVQGDTVTFTDLLPPGEFKVDYRCAIN